VANAGTAFRKVRRSMGVLLLRTEVRVGNRILAAHRVVRQSGSQFADRPYLGGERSPRVAQKVWPAPCNEQPWFRWGTVLHPNRMRGLLPHSSSFRLVLPKNLTHSASSGIGSAPSQE
jgi:hypothetical protein